MENEQIRESLQDIIRYLENYEEVEHLPANPSQAPKQTRFSSIRDVLRKLNEILNSIH
ncbi:TPA: hypothetical protein ACJITD_001368 [Legionella pneumophila]|uniref:hypothetical protein n=1 Tax=Legionella pneumophila TaxID=446 RepID=UPI001A32668C|nr:hypothetical protein [Legionella pneumophila]MDW8900894.1 hypothetical protein [Legionella pneumophila]MDW8906321.1 hypothetical protein [Legionella pneumophila]MDW9177196.1 hypothetical protein [Legionella pneumophila]WII17062.1 hypothetical protein PT257_12075 [Legionella pneumophila]HAT1727195.1 hypothetical protein [Legionella pneumophila]